MNTRLKHIENWEELAQEANWSVDRLAKQNGVSVRALERYFKGYMGKSPKKWLNDCRQQRAIKLLRAGYSVKEAAVLLNYKHPSHLTNEFKKHWGHCPTINKETPGGQKDVNRRVFA